MAEPKAREVVPIRLSADERATIERAAKKAETPPSTFIRNAALGVASGTPDATAPLVDGPKGFAYYKEGKVLPLDSIKVIYSDGNGTLWGIPYRMRQGQSPKNLMGKNGAPDDWIYLGNGRSWFGTMSRAQVDQVKTWLESQGNSVPGDFYEWSYTKEEEATKQGEAKAIDAHVFSPFAHDDSYDYARGPEGDVYWRGPDTGGVRWEHWKRGAEWDEWVKKYHPAMGLGEMRSVKDGAKKAPREKKASKREKRAKARGGRGKRPDGQKRRAKMKAKTKLTSTELDALQADLLGAVSKSNALADVRDAAKKKLEKKNTDQNRIRYEHAKRDWEKAHADVETARVKWDEATSVPSGILD